MVTDTEENFLKHYRHKRILLYIVCAGIILTSGIVIGAGATILLVKHKVIWISHRTEDAAEEAREMRDEYGLNQQQTNQIEAVYNRAFERKQLRQKENSKKRDEEAQIFAAEIKEVLTPQQFERWNKDFQVKREKYKDRFKDK